MKFLHEEFDMKFWAELMDEFVVHLIKKTEKYGILAMHVFMEFL